MVVIKIAICDDNEIQTDLLEEIILDYISLRGLDATVSKFYDGMELIKSVKNSGNYDIYILDMIMPKVNGLEVASTLRMLKDEGKIIFLTSTVEYAVSSYDVRAFYYMLKPLDVNKLQNVLDEALADKRNSSDAVSVYIKSDSGEFRVSSHDIMFVELVNRCPVYHLKNGQQIKTKLIRGSFKEEVHALAENDDFAFCGIGLLINMNFLNAIDSDSLLLSDGTMLYPSKSGLSDIKKVFRNR